jgi:ABC-type multidrug transport system permease subunit
MQTWGNLWAVFALVSIGAATFSSFGLIVASVTNSMQETQVINNLVWSAFLFLSGATIPLMIFPGWIQHVALFLPGTYLATGLEGAMLRTVGIREVAGDVLALAIGLVAAFEISRQLFRWEPEAKVSGRAKLWVVVVMVPFLLFGLWENVYGTRLTQLRQNFQAFSERGPQNPTK